MDIPSAKVLMRTAYICSRCEVALRLKVGDKFPKNCPHCGIAFEFSYVDSGSIDNVEESIVSLKTAH